MNADTRRDCAAVNAAFIDSQRMYAALRLFCKHGSGGDLSRPFWSVSRGCAYACSGSCAMRIETEIGPSDGAPAESVHAKTLEDLASTDGELLAGLDLQSLYEAAEVSLATSRERNGRVERGAFDGRSDMAFVSVPGVGVYRADYLLDVHRAFSLLHYVPARVYSVGCGEKNSMILRFGEYRGGEQAFVCAMHGGNVRDSRWVVVEAGTLRERVERCFSDIVGVAK